MNKLIEQYKSFSQNTQFKNNPLLVNNPSSSGFMADPLFQQRLQSTKLEQMKRIKKIDDLNISKEKLLDYIICPLKTEAINQENALTDYHKLDDTYGDKPYAKKILDEWYKTRTNIPYKNFLKSSNVLTDADYVKKYEFDDDGKLNPDGNKLIIQKVSALTKDELKLIAEYEKMERLLEKHDDELKIIYSLSEQAKHKQQFEFANKSKNRVKFDPKDIKDINDLKKIFEKENKKSSKYEKRIDELIESALDSDDDNNENNTDVTKQKIKPIDIVNDLESQLRSELGEDEYHKILEEVKQSDNGDNHNNSNNNEIVNKVIESKPKRRIKSIVVNEITTIGTVDSVTLSKYKKK